MAPVALRPEWTWTRGSLLAISSRTAPGGQVGRPDQDAGRGRGQQEGDADEHVDGAQPRREQLGRGRARHGFGTGKGGRLGLLDVALGGQGHGRSVRARRLHKSLDGVGPHCEATESFTPITWWSRTARSPLNPGRLAKVTAVCWQQTVSARNT